MILHIILARLVVLALLGSLLACGAVPMGRDDSSSFLLGGGPPTAQPVPAQVLLAPDRPPMGLVGLLVSASLFFLNALAGLCGPTVLDGRCTP
jgi:hypothetical protein